MTDRKKQALRLKAEKSKLIIEAALKVFSAEGYHKARMENIAELAGIGKGTVYEYFSGKLELFKATIEDSFNIYYQMFEAEAKQSSSMDNLVYDIFSSHIEFCQRHWELANIIFKEQHSLGADFEEWMRNFHIEQREKIADCIRSAIDLKQIRPVDIEVLNQVIMGIMSGLAFSVVVCRETEDIGETCRKARDILMQGIALK